MAISMALEPSFPENPFVAGPYRVAAVRITGDASYSSGGSTVDAAAAAIGIYNVLFVEPQMAEGGTNEMVWDGVNRKLKVFVSSTGNEQSGSDAARVYPALVWGN